MSAVKILAIVTVISLAFYTFSTTFSTQKSINSDLSNLWAQWKSQYSISYPNSQEDNFRFGVFAENYAKILAHNAGGFSFELVLNKFADLTPEEFKATYASCVGPTGTGGLNDEYCPSAENCPTFPNAEQSTFNWTAKGAVTGVKNQGQCGSCWAFSTTGALEGLNYINSSTLLSFSEQQLVDCAVNCEACDGCWPYLAMVYASTYGIELESEYPYQGEQGECQYEAKLAHDVNTGYLCVQQKSANQLKAALAQMPVSVAVQANQMSWQFYGGGVVDILCGAELDHAVLLTGIGTHRNKDAYYVKNSWGADWGDHGYIWISTNDAANQGYGVCGILRCATLAVNNP